MKKHKYKEPEIYSTTGFKDVLASPVFYAIATIAFVLGVSTIFGFLQNPLRLKAVVSVIHQKVSPEVSERTIVTHNAYSLSESFNKNHYKNNGLVNINKEARVIRYQDTTEYFGNNNNTEKHIQHVSFNYDITSHDFWSNLDSSSLESVTGELKRKEIEASMIGTPLEPDFQQNTDKIDDSIYVLKI